MKLVQLLAVAVLVSLAAARRLDFALVYEGSCAKAPTSSSEHCSLKSGSETLKTIIGANGDIEFSHSRGLGSISIFNTTTSVTTGKTTGFLTFGVHQTHEAHRLNVEMTNVTMLGKQPVANWHCAAEVWNVVSGAGAFAGAFGQISVNGCWMQAGSEAPSNIRTFVSTVVWLP